MDERATMTNMAAEIGGGILLLVLGGAGLFLPRTRFDAIFDARRLARNPVFRLKTDDRVGRYDQLLEGVLRRIPGLDAERIVAHVPDDIPVLHTDRQLLGRVLTNLLENAWKFTGKRGRAHIDWGPDTTGALRPVAQRQPI
mgnify:CR=1 FL=1